MTDEDLRCALAAVRRAIVNGGRFAFETRNPAARAWDLWVPEAAVNVSLPDEGKVRITTQVVAPFDGDMVTFTHTFSGKNERLPLVSASTLRFLEPPVLAAHLDRSGFRIEAQYGGWDGCPLGADSPEIITIAVPA